MINFPARLPEIIYGSPENILAAKSLLAAAKAPSQAVLFNRALANFVRKLDHLQHTAKNISWRARQKPNAKDPDIPGDVDFIRVDIPLIDKHWQQLKRDFIDVAATLPADAIAGLEKYFTPTYYPKPVDFEDWVKSVKEWVYQILRHVVNLKQERRLPPSLLKLKPSDRYAGNRDVLDDFGSLLQEVMRGKIMVENNLPGGTDQVMLPQDQDRDPRLQSRQGINQNQQLFVQHHLSRIANIQAAWRKLSSGVMEIIKTDEQDVALLADELNERTRNAPPGGSPEQPAEWGTYAGHFLEGYRDLMTIALPLTRDLDNKYMAALPRAVGRTFLQARQAIFIWYKAVAERLTKLYQFLQQYMGLRSFMAYRRLARVKLLTSRDIYSRIMNTVRPLLDRDHVFNPEQFRVLLHDLYGLKDKTETFLRRTQPSFEEAPHRQQLSPAHGYLYSADTAVDYAEQALQRFYQSGITRQVDPDGYGYYPLPLGLAQALTRNLIVVTNRVNDLVKAGI